MLRATATAPTGEGWGGKAIIRQAINPTILSNGDIHLHRLQLVHVMPNPGLGLPRSGQNDLGSLLGKPPTQVRIAPSPKGRDASLGTSEARGVTWAVDRSRYRLVSSSLSLSQHVTGFLDETPALSEIALTPNEGGGLGWAAGKGLCLPSSFPCQLLDSARGC